MTEAKAKKPAAKKAAPAKAEKTGKKVKVTQIHSGAGRLKNQQATLVGLGLSKLHRSKVLEDTPSVRGMINTVKHLIKVEEVA